MSHWQAPDIREEIVISTGQALALSSWEELNQLSQSLRKEAAALGRTAYHRRKNAAEIARLEDDLVRIGREQGRRYALTTFSFCGLTFYISDCWGLEDGSAVYQLSRECRPNGLCSRLRPVQCILVTEQDLNECLLRGAIRHDEPDPCAPWKVATETLERPGESS